MASGAKEVVVNTNERAISADINRLQKFASHSRAEALRYLLNVSYGTDDLDAAAVPTEYSSLEAPLRAEILNGFLVRPQLGNFDLYIDPGVLFAIAPDAALDDSNYKYVKDAGISTPAALVMATNGGGAARIDVIEVQLTDVITETALRDIYNASSSTFVATSVTKAREDRLTYRVRQGTAGGGFPGVASGWLPLAVAHVPVGAASNNAITFWDVRPLLSDREYQPLLIGRDLPRYGRMMGQYQEGGLLTGHVEMFLGGRRLGGRIRRGTPGASAESFNPLNAENQQSGYTPVTQSYWCIYACTPFGLPRWARYTDSPSARVPRSPRGIFVVSHVQPDHKGNPSAVIPLPTSTGLGGNVATNEAILVSAAPYIVASGESHRGFIMDGGALLYRMKHDLTLGQPWMQFIDQSGSAPTFIDNANNVARVRWVDGTQYPACARADLVSLRFTLTGTSNTLYPVTLRPYDPGAAQGTGATLGPYYRDLGDSGINIPTISNHVSVYNREWWEPLGASYPSTQYTQRHFDISGMTMVNISGMIMRHLGWKY